MVQELGDITPFCGVKARGGKRPFAPQKPPEGKPLLRSKSPRRENPFCGAKAPGGKTQNLPSQDSLNWDEYGNFWRTCKPTDNAPISMFRGQSLEGRILGCVIEVPV
jgi:hypothetical protein